MDGSFPSIYMSYVLRFDIYRKKIIEISRKFRYETVFGICVCSATSIDLHMLFFCSIFGMCFVQRNSSALDFMFFPGADNQIIVQ